MKKKQVPKVRIDDLVTGALPQRILNAIEKQQLTVGELQAWEQSKPNLKIGISDRRLNIDIRLRLPLTKSMVLVAGVLGVLGAGIKLAAENLDVLRVVFKAG